jgi:hypothetical protein
MATFVALGDEDELPVAFAAFELLLLPHPAAASAAAANIGSSQRDLRILNSSSFEAP